jgi:hypothetical protein
MFWKQAMKSSCRKQTRQTACYLKERFLNCNTPTFKWSLRSSIRPRVLYFSHVCRSIGRIRPIGRYATHTFTHATCRTFHHPPGRTRHALAASLPGTTHIAGPPNRAARAVAVAAVGLRPRWRSHRRRWQATIHSQPRAGTDGHRRIMRGICHGNSIWADACRHFPDALVPRPTLQGVEPTNSEIDTSALFFSARPLRNRSQLLRANLQAGHRRAYLLISVFNWSLCSQLARFFPFASCEARSIHHWC